MRQRQILIVEDNYLLLDMLTDLCHRQGIGAMPVSSGESAVAAIREAGAGRKTVDLPLLLTDINLPGLIDGWTVAQVYRTLNPDLPVIYTSTGIRCARRAVSRSVFLNKPFRIADVVALAWTMMRPVPETRVPRMLCAAG